MGPNRGFAQNIFVSSKQGETLGTPKKSNDNNNNNNNNNNTNTNTNANKKNNNNNNNNNSNSSNNNNNNNKKKTTSSILSAQRVLEAGISNPLGPWHRPGTVGAYHPGGATGGSMVVKLDILLHGSNIKNLEKLLIHAALHCIDAAIYFFCLQMLHVVLSSQ